MSEFINNPCTNFYELKETLENYHVHYDAVEDNFSNLSKKDLPTIAQVKSTDDVKEFDHFVTITKLNKFRVVYYDVNKGMCKLSPRKFNLISSNNFMVFNKLEANKKKKHIPCLVSKKDILLQVICTLILTVFSVLSLVLFEVKKLSYFSIMFAFLALLVVAFQIFFLFRTSKKVDSNIVFNYLAKYDELKLSELVKYKAKLFLNFNTFIISISSLLILLILEGTRDLKGLILDFEMILLYLTVSFLSKEKIFDFNYKAQKTEESLISLDKESKEFKDGYNKAVSLSFKGSFYENAPLIITSSIVLGYYFITNSLNANAGLTSLIFYSTYHMMVLLVMARIVKSCNSLKEYNHDLLRLDYNFVKLMNYI